VVVTNPVPRLNRSHVIVTIVRKFDDQFAEFPRPDELLPAQTRLPRDRGFDRLIFGYSANFPGQRTVRCCGGRLAGAG
jgi:hypothetical protein